MWKNIGVAVWLRFPHKTLYLLNTTRGTRIRKCFILLKLKIKSLWTFENSFLHPQLWDTIIANWRRGRKFRKLVIFHFRNEMFADSRSVFSDAQTGLCESLGHIPTPIFFHQFQVYVNFHQESTEHFFSAHEWHAAILSILYTTIWIWSRSATVW